MKTFPYRKSLILLTAVALAIAAMPSASAANGVATRGDLLIEIESPERAHATVEQHWEGEDARGLRQSLDVFFGAGDGQLTAGEVDNIVFATQEDMRGGTIPYFAIDGNGARVANVSLTLTDAPGSAESTAPITMRHVIELALTPGAGPEHTLTILPLWNGTLTVRTPEGWTVSGTDTADPRAEATASMTPGAGVNLTLAPAAETPTSQNNTTSEPPRNGEVPDEATGAGPGQRPTNIPTTGGLLVMAAFALAGIAYAVWRRRS